MKEQILADIKECYSEMLGREIPNEEAEEIYVNLSMFVDAVVLFFKDPDAVYDPKLDDDSLDERVDAKLNKYK